MSSATFEGEPGEQGSIHERRRKEILGEVPRWYSPALHFAIPAAIGLGVMALSIAQIHGLRAIELLTIPITLIGGLGFEWRVHQLVLHRKMPLLSELYIRHELHHHVVFTYDDMPMRSSKEFRLVLMPAYGVLLSFLVSTPLAYALHRFVGANTAFLFMATSMFFFLSYEWLHLAYHFPSDSLVGRLPLIARLREQHRRHHDPRLMKRWNFNVTVPLFDWIHRTTWSPEREAERDRAAKRDGKRGAQASGAAAPRHV